MASRGRPTIFSPDVAHRLCQRLLETRSLVKACRTPGMPKAATVYMWKYEGLADIEDGNPDTPKAQFSREFARAQRLQAELMRDDVVEIVNNDSQDLVIGNGRNGLPKGTRFENRVKVSRDKLRADKILEIAGRLNPSVSDVKRVANADGSNLPTGFVTLSQLMNPEEKPHTETHPKPAGTDSSQQ